MRSVIVAVALGIFSFGTLLQQAAAENCDPNRGYKIISYIDSKIDEYGKLSYDCPSGLPTDPEQFCEIHCTTMTDEGKLNTFNSNWQSGDSMDFPEGGIACTACVVEDYS